MADIAGASQRNENEDGAKQIFVAAQFRETMQGKIPEVTCGCGLKMPLRFAFKCVYCCEYYCQSCAEAHFGKTRAEYYAEKAARNLAP